MTSTDFTELLERYKNIENEIKLLQEDKKQVLEEFKDKVSPKAFKAALASARNRAKLKPHETTDYDQMVEIFENTLSIEHVE